MRVLKLGYQELSKNWIEDFRQAYSTESGINENLKKYNKLLEKCKTATYSDTGSSGTSISDEEDRLAHIIDRINYYEGMEQRNSDIILISIIAQDRMNKLQSDVFGGLVFLKMNKSKLSDEMKVSRTTVYKLISQAETELSSVIKDLNQMNGNYSTNEKPV